MADGEERDLAVLLNRLFSFVREIHEFIVPLSRGQLDEPKVPPARNFLASPFKELHSHLQHLTWQAEQVAKGDYSQRVDFMGDFSTAFQRHDRLPRRERQGAEGEDRAVGGCAGPHREARRHPADLHPLQEGAGQRRRSEGPGQLGRDPTSYIARKTETRFSHGVCPKCMKAHYPDLIV